MPLFLLFLAVPLIEIGLFIQVGGLIGLWPTLGIVILTAVAGTWMIRQQGVREMSLLRQSFEELRDPSEPLANGAMILFAGALLLTPGFFTDTVGLLLLIPGVRKAIYGYLRQKVTVAQFQMGPGPSQPRPPHGDVIDGDYEEVKPNSGNIGSSGWTRH